MYLNDILVYYSIMQDRVYGMYVGGALGDALGAPHEFNNRVQYTAIKESEESNINILYRSHLEESQFRNYSTFTEGCEHINRVITLLDTQPAL